MENLSVKETFSGGTALLRSVKMNVFGFPLASLPGIGFLLRLLSRKSVWKAGTSDFLILFRFLSEIT